MKRFPLDTIAMMSGALLYVFLQMYAVAAGAAILLLLQLFEAAPRVALFGILLVAIAPVVAITLIHHGADRTMAKKDVGLLPTAEAWWAGTLGWLVMVGSTAVTSIVMLVIEPPEREGGAASLVQHLGALALAAPAKTIVHGAVWITVASILYGIERAAREKA